MRFATYAIGSTPGLATAKADGSFTGLLASDTRYPGDLDDLVARGPGALRAAHVALLAGQDHLRGS